MVKRGCSTWREGASRVGWLEDGGSRLLRAAPGQLLRETGLAVRSAITENISVFLSQPLSAIFDGKYETFMSRLHLHSDKQGSDFGEVWFDALCVKPSYVCVSVNSLGAVSKLQSAHSTVVCLLGVIHRVV